MAVKRTRKDQIDSGKKELPRKLAFLHDMKVDFLSIAHDEATDEHSVELSATALKAMTRKVADLKDLKASHKDVAKQAALVPELLKDREQLLALREASDAADEVMRKALRRIKALEKELGLAPGAKTGKRAAKAAPEPLTNGAFSA